MRIQFTVFWLSWIFNHISCLLEYMAKEKQQREVEAAALAMQCILVHVGTDSTAPIAGKFNQYSAY